MPPLIVGAGPAGAAAAIALSAHGTPARIIERSREVGNAICGGFVSWRTLASLEKLGIDSIALGGHPVTRLAVFAGNARGNAALPFAAVGLSRHRLDSVLLETAIARGASVERDLEARAIEGTRLRFADGSTQAADAVFLATGKHDLRGAARTRLPGDPTLGLRIRIAPHPQLTRLIGDAIELHLFDRCYVGLLLQEDGSTNLCLAARKSRLVEAGGKPQALLEELGRATPLGERLAFADACAADAIAAIPYGWSTAETEPGVFRLGDQAAVIPSLAGEGIGIAIASGIAAADHFAQGGAGAAQAFQAAFARRTRPPIRVARMLWHNAERPSVAAAGTRLLAALPPIARAAAFATRIRD